MSAEPRPLLFAVLWDALSCPWDARRNSTCRPHGVAIFLFQPPANVLTSPHSYIPVVYCLNKIDSISIEELDLLYQIPHAVPISSEHGWNLDELMEAMWEKLNLKRVYTKPKGKSPDYSAPVVLRSNRSTVEDFVSYSLPTNYYEGARPLSSPPPSPVSRDKGPIK